MDKKRVLFTFLIFALFSLLIPLISAIDTTVKVSTYPNYDLELQFLDPTPASGQSPLIKKFNLNTGTEGELTVTFSTNLDSFDVTAFVLNNGEKIVYERFDANKAGEPIQLILFPGDTQIVRNFVEEVNTTNTTEETQPVENTTNVSETQENSPGITGLTAGEDVGGESIFSNKAIYYIIGLIVLGVVAFFGVPRLKQANIFKSDGTGKKTKEIKTVKLSNIKGKDDRVDKEYKKTIEDAEEKIREAQQEIKKLKNVEKIDEIKKRMAKEQDELKKLSGE